jgi:hypothetical protein
LQKHPGTAKTAVMGENQPKCSQRDFTFIPPHKTIVAAPEESARFLLLMIKKEARKPAFIDAKTTPARNGYYDVILEKEYSVK